MHKLLLMLFLSTNLFSGNCIKPPEQKKEYVAPKPILKKAVKIKQETEVRTPKKVTYVRRSYYQVFYRTRR